MMSLKAKKILNENKNNKSLGSDIAKKLKIIKRKNIKVIQVNTDGICINSNISWTEKIITL